jgi:HSP20 family protein
MLGAGPDGAHASPVLPGRRWGNAGRDLATSKAVIRTRASLWVAVALPGVENQDIEITIEHDVLVISGARHLPTLPRGVAIHRLEIPYGRFERQVQLPSGQFELTRPDITDGCLFITLAKR